MSTLLHASISSSSPPALPLPLPLRLPHIYGFSLPLIFSFLPHHDIISVSYTTKNSTWQSSIRDSLMYSRYHLEVDLSHYCFSPFLSLLIIFISQLKGIKCCLQFRFNSSEHKNYYDQKLQWHQLFVTLNHFYDVGKEIEKWSLKIPPSSYQIVHFPTNFFRSFSFSIHISFTLQRVKRLSHHSELQSIAMDVIRNLIQFQEQRKKMSLSSRYPPLSFSIHFICPFTRKRTYSLLCSIFFHIRSICKWYGIGLSLTMDLNINEWTEMDKEKEMDRKEKENENERDREKDSSSMTSQSSPSSSSSSSSSLLPLEISVRSLVIRYRFTDLFSSLLFSSFPTLTSIALNLDSLPHVMKDMGKLIHTVKNTLNTIQILESSLHQVKLMSEMIPHLIDDIYPQITEFDIQFLAAHDDTHMANHIENLHIRDLPMEERTAVDKILCKFPNVKKMQQEHFSLSLWNHVSPSFSFSHITHFQWHISPILLFGHHQHSSVVYQITSIVERMSSLLSFEWKETERLPPSLNLPHPGPQTGQAAQRVFSSLTSCRNLQNVSIVRRSFTSEVSSASSFSFIQMISTSLEQFHNLRILSIKYDKDRDAGNINLKDEDIHALSNCINEEYHPHLTDVTLQHIVIRSPAAQLSLIKLLCAFPSQLVSLRVSVHHEHRCENDDDVDGSNQLVNMSLLSAVEKKENHDILINVSHRSPSLCKNVSDIMRSMSHLQSLRKLSFTLSLSSVIADDIFSAGEVVKSFAKHHPMLRHLYLDMQMNQTQSKSKDQYGLLLPSFLSLLDPLQSLTVLPWLTHFTLLFNGTKWWMESDSESKTQSDSQSGNDENSNGQISISSSSSSSSISSSPFSSSSTSSYNDLIRQYSRMRESRYRRMKSNEESKCN